jgi:hypothetical protein
MPAGRPTAYKEEYCEQARKLCLLGLTDKEMAKYFEITEKTLNNWKNDYPEFLQSLKEGKENADANVAISFYKRALGYEHPEDKIFNNNGAAMIVPTIKHYPPDSAACLSWLKNRQPDKWRDKHEVAHSFDTAVIDELKEKYENK